MRLKPGVRLLGLQPQMLVALMVAEGIYTKHSTELVVTSGVEASHSRASKHYAGCAVDIRSRTLVGASAAEVASEISEALGDDYDVVVEKDHLHIEWEPKKALNL